MKHCDASAGAATSPPTPRLGHLLTRNLAEQEQSFDPDPEARADGIERHRRFLVSLGFVAK